MTHWMPLYIADYLADTTHLSATEHGAYLLLIMHYWTNGGLPDDDKRLARIARLSAKEWAEAKPILQEFFVDGWRHSRIEQEMLTAHEKYEKRAAAGKKGGIAKAQRQSSNATAMPAKRQKQRASNATAMLPDCYKQTASNALPTTTTTTTTDKNPTSLTGEGYGVTGGKNHQGRGL